MTVLSMSRPSLNKNAPIRQTIPQPALRLTDQARAQALRNVTREVRRLLQEQSLRAQTAGGQYRPRSVSHSLSASFNKEN